MCRQKSQNLSFTLFLFFLIVIGAGINDVFADKTENLGSNSECMEILDLLATLEGLDYRGVDIAERLFGDEKINFEVETWKGSCYYGIGTLDGKVVIVSNRQFKNPTLLAFSESKTVKALFKNPDVKLFQEAIDKGRIRIEHVGFAEGIKVGLLNILNIFNRLYPPTEEEVNKTGVNITFPMYQIYNFSWEDDLDGDGIYNSEDSCDPYVLKEELGGEGIIVKYYTCPSHESPNGEYYVGNSPYDDIYDYVMNNGCGMKDMDGGIRYYTKGSICIENVSFIPPEEMGVSMGAPPGSLPPFTIGEVVSQCEIVYTDYCLDDETLVEYYYETPKMTVSSFFNPLTRQMETREIWASGGIRNITYKCPLGCENGACVVRDVDSLVYPYDPEYYMGELRYGFNPWEKSYYGRENLKYVALKAGKSIDEIDADDFFGDECIDQNTLREYYLTVETTWGVFGRLEDKIIVKSDEFNCHLNCSNGKCNPEHCFDGIKNQGESDVDCGGPCYPCRPKNVCTKTSACYVPSDTTCDDKWRPGVRTMKCEIYEVCSDEIDYIVEEAYKCAEYVVNNVDVQMFDRALCSHVRDVISQELGINIQTLSSFEKRKLVAGIYIVEGLGDPTFNRGWMNYYLREEFCCSNVTGGSKGWCWDDVSTCLTNNSVQPSNFWNMLNSCLIQLNKSDRVQLYQSFLNNITKMVCEKRNSYDVWRNDAILSQNSIYASVPPAHASLNIMHTGTCADYASAVVTLLRKAGYTCDEVFSTTYPGHVWNVVKFPGMDKWVIVDTTGGDRDGIRSDPPKKQCEVFNQTKNEEKYQEELNKTGKSSWCINIPPYNDPNSPHYCARPLTNDCTNIYREFKEGEVSTYGIPADELIQDEKDVFGCD